MLSEQTLLKIREKLGRQSEADFRKLCDFLTAHPEDPEGQPEAEPDEKTAAPKVTKPADEVEKEYGLPEGTLQAKPETEEEA